MDATTVLDDLRQPTRDLRRAIPRVYEAFGTLHDVALADGALDTTTKELVALAVAVAKGCDGCIAYHARALAQREADPQQVAEAIGVVVLMDGGPAASGHGPEAFAAFQRFAAEREARRSA